MRVTVHDSIAGIPADDWNRLAGNDYPFLRHEFLRAAEESGSVCGDVGWLPRHLTVERAGRLVGAMPLYEKDHSWGEFVFDWAWAHAYERAGVPYYPKLVSTVPYTPAPSRRLLLADDSDDESARALVAGAIALASESGCSSLHVLFPDERELPALQRAGLRLRKDCQFHWHNRGYRDFDEFLQTFTAKKRKKARRDRRHVAEAGIRMRWLHGAEIEPETWDTIYRFISITFMRRGSLPYYNLEFFRRISETLPDSLLAVLAESDRGTVAAALFYRSDRALWGRYWGTDSYHNALHFETCYYQGIDYCIEHGLELFEPGTQGEHKISRGFAPVPTWSAHWLAQPEFFSAIGEYLDEEQRHVDRYIDAIDRRTPYRDESGGAE